MENTGAAKLQMDLSSNLDALTMRNPHTDDPRFMKVDQRHNCRLRYSMFCRCCRELGEDHTRCKYQFYRAQVACVAEKLDDWEDQRQRGACHLDVLPDRSTYHLRQ